MLETQNKTTKKKKNSKFIAVVTDEKKSHNAAHLRYLSVVKREKKKKKRHHRNRRRNTSFGVKKSMSRKVVKCRFVISRVIKFRRWKRTFKRAPVCLKMPSDATRPNQQATDECAARRWIHEHTRSFSPSAHLSPPRYNNVVFTIRCFLAFGIVLRTWQQRFCRGAFFFSQFNTTI